MREGKILRPAPLKKKTWKRILGEEAARSMTYELLPPPTMNSSSIISIAAVTVGDYFILLDLAHN